MEYDNDYLTATIVGGAIAAVSGAITTLIAQMLTHRKRQSRVAREAVASWSGAFECCLSLTHDFYGLVLRIPDPPDDMWKKNYIQAMHRAADAGRELDVCAYKALLLVRKEWVRNEIEKLTKDSKLTEKAGGDIRDAATSYRASTEKLRGSLLDFLKRLSAAGRWA